MYNNEFRPNWASAPGDTIKDVLFERNISIDDFAQRMQNKVDAVNDLLQGRTAITLATARQLEKILGASVEYWMARDFQYRQDIARFSVTAEQWVGDLPIEDMIRFGWLSPIKQMQDIVSACLDYFNISTVKEWYEKYASVLQKVPFKKSPTYEIQPAPVATWLRQGEIQAEEIDCQPWDANKFKESLSKIRSLTTIKDPTKFVPELTKICAQSGVAVVVVRTPRGCPVSGATKFISNDKALLLLSFRHLTDDHFWFAFFHEAGHLFLHTDLLRGNKDFFLEDADSLSTIEEEAANEFAENIIIPPEYKSKFRALFPSTRNVIRFAVEIGIAPGLIVGQLHHSGRVPYRQLTKLQRHYRWED